MCKCYKGFQGTACQHVCVNKCGAAVKRLGRGYGWVVGWMLRSMHAGWCELGVKMWKVWEKTRRMVGRGANLCLHVRRYPHSLPVSLNPKNNPTCLCALHPRLHPTLVRGHPPAVTFPIHLCEPTRHPPPPPTCRWTALCAPTRAAAAASVCAASATASVAGSGWTAHARTPLRQGLRTCRAGSAPSCTCMNSHTRCPAPRLAWTMM